MASKLGSPASTVSQTPASDTREDILLIERQPASRFARKKHVSQWIPEVEPSHPRAKTFRTWHSRRDVMLWTSTILAFSILTINVAFTLVFCMIDKSARAPLPFPTEPSQNYIGTIFTGTHAQVTRISTLIHVIINLLSSLLLGASNMCMQLCVAPTRTELDRAHQACQWLDIGVPSLRNLRWIQPARIVLIFFLALSSIPLHFLYNSAVFPSLAVNTYEWILVNPSFLEKESSISSWNFTATLDYQETQPCPATGTAVGWQQIWVDRLWKDYQDRSKPFYRLSNLECLQKYLSSFGPRSDLIVVTTDESAKASNNSLIWMGNWGAVYLSHPGDWVCYWGFDPAKTQQLSELIQLSSANCAIFGSLEYFTGDTDAQKKQHRSEIADNWQVAGHKVSYCLATEHSTKDLYTLSFSKSIMIIIYITNCIKFFGILATAWWYSKHKDPPISILGDAIASFLENPDPMTRQLGACSKKDIKDRQKGYISGKPISNTSRWRNPMKNYRDPLTGDFQWGRLMARLRFKSNHSHDEAVSWLIPAKPREWKPTFHRWFRGASLGRWALAVILCLLVIFVSIGFLASGIIASGSGLVGLTRSEKLAFIYSIGFGKPSPSALVSFLKGGTTYSNSIGLFYQNVIFANVWQFLISFLYLLINALVTSMLVGCEWAHYGRHRKPLRVSAPEGIQRSSYFVSIPFRYGVPLIALISVLHWTVSQSVFLVRISSYFSTGEPDIIGSTSAVGYSPMAITISISIGFSIVLGVTMLGTRKYSRGMPLASTCSAAISAACHAPEEDYDARYFPLMWGIVEQDTRGFSYCSFTTATNVRPLGESDGWKEFELEAEKCQKTYKDKSRKEEGKRRTYLHENTAFKTPKQSKKGDSYRQFLMRLRIWTIFLYIKASRRRSSISRRSSLDSKIPSNKEFYDIVAPWPMKKYHSL